MSDERHGAKQPERFDPARAAILDDTARFAYVPPETVLDALGAEPGSTLVDFGAGTGLYAIEIARRRPDLHVLALDEQPAMLARLRDAFAAAGAANVEAIEPASIPELRGRVARVLALNVLHELGDDALVALRSLLGPGGAALFIDWNADVERPVGPPRDHVYGPDEATRRLTGLGFTIRQARTLPYHYALTAQAAGLAGSGETS